MITFFHTYMIPKLLTLTHGTWETLIAFHLSKTDRTLFGNKLIKEASVAQVAPLIQISSSSTKKSLSVYFLPLSEVS